MRSVLRIISVATVLLMFLIVDLYGQHNHEGVCGTPTNATLNRLLNNKKAIKEGLVYKRNAITYVPIKYILVARTNGTGRVSEEAVLDMHCHLNEVYLDQEIQFYIKDGTFNTTINNDVVYSSHERAQNTIMNLNKDDSAISCFLLQDAQRGTGPGNTLGYYTPQYDWMVVENGQVNGILQTLPHELGHFFSLLHPFNGYDSEPFESSSPGWPTAPVVAPGSSLGGQGSVRSELMDRSNCDTAGDYLCDTEVDYNANMVGSTSCIYSGGAKDPNGVTIDPDETLIMAYFSDQCVERFTENQKEVILADLASPERNRLEKGWTPSAIDVSSNVTIAYPTEDAVAVANGTLTVDWYDVPGATHYIFELGTNRFFNSSESFMIEGSSIELTDLTNRQYFYRIRPFNPYNTCAPKTNAFSFTIVNNQATSTKEIDFVKNFSVFPNPANRNGEVFVSVLSNESFEGEVSIVDFTGKTIYRSFEKFVSGDNQIPVQLNIDANGVYLMLIKSDAGILKKKFVVNE